MQLGCGLGLPALGASLHATSVVASDFSPQAIDALVELIEFNQSRQPPPASSTGFGKIRGEVLDWTHVLAAERAGSSHVTDTTPPPDVRGTEFAYCEAAGVRTAGTLSVPESARVDVVLGADVIYSVEHGLPLAATVDAYLRDGGHLVLTAKNIRLGLSVFFDDIQVPIRSLVSSAPDVRRLQLSRWVVGGVRLTWAPVHTCVAEERF